MDVWKIGVKIFNPTILSYKKKSISWLTNDNRLDIFYSVILLEIYNHGRWIKTVYFNCNTFYCIWKFANFIYLIIPLVYSFECRRSSYRPQLLFSSFTFRSYWRVEILSGFDSVMFSTAGFEPAILDIALDEVNKSNKRLQKSIFL